MFLYYSRIVTIFKKGSRSVCGNYRGICIRPIYLKFMTIDLHVFYATGFHQGSYHTESRQVHKPNRYMKHIRKCLYFMWNSQKRTLHCINTNFGCLGLQRQRHHACCSCLYVCVLLSSESLSIITCTVGVRQFSPTSWFFVYLLSMEACKNQY